MDTEEVAHLNGFTDAAEMFRMIAAVDLAAPGAHAAFVAWKEDDGSKEGLAALPVRKGAAR